MFICMRVGKDPSRFAGVLAALCCRQSGVGEANRKWLASVLIDGRPHLPCDRLPSDSLHGCRWNEAASSAPLLQSALISVSMMSVVGRAVVRRLLSHLWLAHSFLFLRCDHHDGLAV